MQNVKSTMIDRLLGLVAPHYCRSCGGIGSLLCDGCKQDIIESDATGCLLCPKPAGERGVCVHCSRFVGRGWFAGERSGCLEELVDAYKFEHARAACMPLADLLLARLPFMPAETVIIPIPTVPAHVRQRGFDQTMLLANCIASKRKLDVQNVLERRDDSSQRGANKAQRLLQAKKAFTVRQTLRPDIPYLILDDVITTGATITYAAKALKDAGAKIVWAAAVARQPLEINR